MPDISLDRDHSPSHERAMAAWISRAIHGDPGEPAPVVNSPNILRDFIHERLHPAGEIEAQVVPAAPIANTDEASARAWSILTDGQRALVASGDAEVVEHFETLAEIYRGDDMAPPAEGDA